MKLLDLKTKKVVTNNPTHKGGKPVKRICHFYVCNKCKSPHVIMTVFGRKNYRHQCEKCGEKYQ